MIDHISVPVRDLKVGAAFYEKVLATLGYVRLVDREDTVGFGKRYPEVWLNLRPGLVAEPAGNGFHLCLRARSEAVVRAFFDAALAAGGVSAGEPGPRQAAMTGYYAAFIEDPDGHRIEAATFPATAP